MLPKHHLNTEIAPYFYLRIYLIIEYSLIYGIIFYILNTRKNDMLPYLNHQELKLGLNINDPLYRDKLKFRATLSSEEIYGIKSLSGFLAKHITTPTELIEDAVKFMCFRDNKQWTSDVSTWDVETRKKYSQTMTVLYLEVLKARGSETVAFLKVVTKFIGENKPYIDKNKGLSESVSSEGGKPPKSTISMPGN